MRRRAHHGIRPLRVPIHTLGSVEAQHLPLHSGARAVTIIRNDPPKEGAMSVATPYPTQLMNVPL